MKGKCSLAIRKMLGWHKYKDEQQLISDIEVGGYRTDKAIEYVYTHYRKEVLYFIVKSNKYLIKDDALDIFQDTVVILVRNIQSGKFRKESNIKTYLKGIARNISFRLAQKHYNKVQVEVDIDYQPQLEADTNTETLYQRSELSATLEDLLNSLPGKGAQIIRLWMKHYSMREIADIMGFKNEQNARNAKKRHLQRLISLVSENEVLAADLKLYLEQ